MYEQAFRTRSMLGALGFDFEPSGASRLCQSL